MAVAISDEHKAKIIAAYTASGQPMAAWVKSVQDDPELKVSIGSLRNWLGLNKERSTSGVSGKAPSRASSRTGVSLMARFEEQYQAERDQKLLAFLEQEVKDLEAQLSAAQLEVRKQKVHMGLEDAPVEY
jgi:hypothetical protein